MVRQSDPSAVPKLGIDISTFRMYSVRNHSPTRDLLLVKQSGDARVTCTLEAPADSASNQWAMFGIVSHTC